jgi:hypothetical protein
VKVTSGALIRYPERVVWTAVLIGVPAWIAHLVYEAAMTEYTSAHPGWRWTLHLATALTALVTLAGMAVCADLVRLANRSEPAGAGFDQAEVDDASTATISRFLGYLGLLIGVTNLALILMEGSYVIFVRRGG